LLEKDILEHLSVWKENHAGFLEIVKRSPVLTEAVGLSENLAKIANIGLQGIDYMNNRSSPPRGWKTESLEITKKAKEQGGRCDLQVVTAIEELVNAANK
jgi:hypothetical protein